MFIDAIIVPLTEKEIDLLYYNLNLMYNYYLPSIDSTNTTLHLVFNNINNKNKTYNAINKIHNFINSTKIFNKLKFTNIAVEKKRDNYRYEIFNNTIYLLSTEGTNIVFYNWYYNFNYNYVLQMETDVIPLRKYWLDILNNELNNNLDFIRLGSKLYDIKLPGIGNNHINGNCIYNLHNKEYKNLTMESWIFIKNKGSIKINDKYIQYYGHDNGFFRYLKNNNLYDKFKNKLLYTDLIVNHSNEICFQKSINLITNNNGCIVHSKYFYYFTIVLFDNFEKEKEKILKQCKYINVINKEMLNDKIKQKSDIYIIDNKNPTSTLFGINLRTLS